MELLLPTYSSYGEKVVVIMPELHLRLLINQIHFQKVCVCDLASSERVVSESKGTSCLLLAVLVDDGQPGAGRPDPLGRPGDV